MALTAKGYLAVEWVLIAVCLVLVCARLAVRTYRRMWSFWLSDVLLVIAFLTFLTLVIGDTWSFVRGNDIFNQYDVIAFNKWLFAADIVFDLGFYFPRFSLLAFYNELFPVSEKRLRQGLYIVTAYNICAFLTTALVDIFWCGTHVSENWATEPTCTLLTATKTLLINWSIGIVAELLVFLLPFGMLRRLKATPKREKIALTCILAIGVASIVATIARLIWSLNSVASYATYIVGSAEIATQIVVGALPALRPLLTMIPLGCSRLFSSLKAPRSTKDDEDQNLYGSSSTGTSNCLEERIEVHDKVDDGPGIELHQRDKDGI
ncbi:hypothetical protein BKA56DRAFT_580525 [Ilyonectria sp. MPI-CAGE-AT-0026]|nr:hypothetical protein BKA56DRAFT_580525 [Ilyonectria sp. MPI-CAGE-AT-0026]